MRLLFATVAVAVLLAGCQGDSPAPASTPFCLLGPGATFHPDGSCSVTGSGGNAPQGPPPTGGPGGSGGGPDRENLSVETPR